MKLTIKIIFSFLFSLTFAYTKAQDSYSSSEDVATRTTVDFLIDYLSIKYPSYNFQDFIYVGVKRQKMYVFKEGRLVKTYYVSTSKNGAGSESGSEMTPVGLHKINGKFGQDVPKGGILIGKKFYGKIAKINNKPVSSENDDITSRVLTLDGLEKGVNKGGDNDSFERHIYIHGTAEEGLIGQPVSHGCVRMTNDDVIELFEIVQNGMYVIILNN